MKTAIVFALLQLLGTHCAEAIKINKNGIRVFDDGSGGNRRLGKGSKMGKGRSATNFCSNSEPQGVFAFQDFDGDSFNTFVAEEFPVSAPFMLVEVKKDEGVLVEASVTTLIFSGIFTGFSPDALFAGAVVEMTVQMMNTETDEVIDPVPAASLPLQVKLSVDEVFAAGGDLDVQQSYGRFLFTGVPEGEYIVLISFNLAAFAATFSAIVGEDEVSLAGVAAVLGNHLISVEKIEDTYSGECAFVEFGGDTMFRFREDGEEDTFAGDLFAGTQAGEP